MSFLGKEYVLASQENFDVFINTMANDLSEDVKKAIIAHKSTAKLVKDGNQYTLTTSLPTGVKELTFTPGVEIDEDVFGVICKSTSVLDGNVLTTVQKFDTGTITYKREFSDNQLVLTITASLWDGAAKRIYKA